MSTHSLSRFALFLSLFAAAAPTVSAQTAVAPYRPGLTAEGITYHLPLTGLHLTVQTAVDIMCPANTRLTRAPYSIART